MVLSAVLLISQGKVFFIEYHCCCGECCNCDDRREDHLAYPVVVGEKHRPMIVEGADGEILELVKTINSQLTEHSQHICKNVHADEGAADDSQ